MDSINNYLAQYETTLYKNVLPFWKKHSIDSEYGGFFTCLDRRGNVYDTDKFVWLQARQVWMFSKLHNEKRQRDKNGEWLDVAEHGAEFLKKNGHDKHLNWYFALDRKGDPLIAPCNIFSDCFAAMALSQYALASKKAWAQELSIKTYKNILKRYQNPKGKFSKVIPGTRPLVSFALPMILLNLTNELEWMLKKELVEQTTQKCISEIVDVFYDERKGLIYEHTSPNGSHPDCFDGRLINPGHGIEAMWFLMDIANRTNNKALINKAVKIVLDTLNFGWDPKYGGIFYFMDSDGKPPQQLEWNQKLWWVHLETLIALLMGFYLTGDKSCWKWFKTVHRWTWQHFADPDYGEWFGYLDRQGKVLIPLKGGKWKGCFHLPRALLKCSQLFELISVKQV